MYEGEPREWLHPPFCHHFKQNYWHSALEFHGVSHQPFKLIRRHYVNADKKSNSLDVRLYTNMTETAPMQQQCPMGVFCFPTENFPRKSQNSKKTS